LRNEKFCDIITPREVSGASGRRLAYFKDDFNSPKFEDNQQFKFHRRLSQSANHQPSHKIEIISYFHLHLGVSLLYQNPYLKEQNVNIEPNKELKN